ncbi:MAG TPA: hypothetical protein VKB69_15525 [Micromonosporaceae bacterium]|nr:hypothetical protein [Micromonosporaceae bacterium]
MGKRPAPGPRPPDHDGQSGTPAAPDPGTAATPEPGTRTAPEPGGPSDTPTESTEPDVGHPDALAAAEPTVSMPQLAPPPATQEPTVPLRNVPKPPGETSTVIMSRIPPAEDDPDRPRTPVTELAARAAARRRRRKPSSAVALTPGARPVGARPTRRPGLGSRLAALDGRILPPIADALVGLGRGARRARALTAVIVMVCFALALVAVYKVAQTSPVSPPPVAAAPSVSPDLRVGVKDGDSIPKYLQAAKTSLQDALSPSAGPRARYALISFKTYLTPDGVRNALAGAYLFSIFMRVYIEGEITPSTYTPEVGNLPGEIERVMLAEANQDRQDSLDNKYKLTVLPSGDPEDAQLRDSYEHAEALEWREQLQYRALCACVYAAVVQADPQTLAEVADRAAVRAVDVVPADRVHPELSIFTPPVPEQSGTATLPPG